VETTALAATERAALIALLDDPSPAVRRALRARFTALGERAGLMLREVAAGGDRQLARHALEYLEELGLSDPAAEFRAYIRGRRYELEAGSLLLARIANPRLDEAACRSQLDAMAARCRELITEPSSTREKCRALNRVLFHECGFHGNTENYTDPRNSFLDQVLERRTGLPISLSIVYLLVAARAGLELEPVGLPGHFLVGCFSDGLPFFIDAFEGGVFRGSADVLDALAARPGGLRPSDLAPTSVAEVLCRSCRNLARHHEASLDPERARLFAGFVGEFEAAHSRQQA
jgi:regulator of sirC expression with transglutaminase-like and TPR domain